MREQSKYFPNEVLNAQDVRELAAYSKQPCCDSALKVAELRLLAIRTEQWWHKEWHQATGIPCDGGSEYCPLSRRELLPDRSSPLEQYRDNLLTLRRESLPVTYDWLEEAITICNQRLG